MIPYTLTKDENKKLFSYTTDNKWFLCTLGSTHVCVISKQNDNTK